MKVNARETPPQAPQLPAKDGAKPEPIATADVRPGYYGGADATYEVFKVIRAWGLDFFTGNLVKYVARAGKKPGATRLQDLIKARTYLNQLIEQEEKKE